MLDCIVANVLHVHAANQEVLRPLVQRDAITRRLDLNVFNHEVGDITKLETVVAMRGFPILICWPIMFHESAMPTEITPSLYFNPSVCPLHTTLRRWRRTWYSGQRLDQPETIVNR